MDERTIDDHLAAAFDGLVGATHLTKQMLWSGASTQREQLQELLAFLSEQTRLVDESERLRGGRSAEVSSPSGRKRPNLLGNVDNDPQAALDAYMAHLGDLAADLRRRAADMGAASEATLLLDAAAGLEDHVSLIK